MFKINCQNIHKILVKSRYSKSGQAKKKNENS